MQISFTEVGLGKLLVRRLVCTAESVAFLTRYILFRFVKRRRKDEMLRYSV